MSTLTDFAKTPEPPHIECRYWIPHPVNMGDMVGTVAHERHQNEKCALFLHRRWHNEDDRRTWNEKYSGYAISNFVLDLLKRRGIRTIYIGVTDEDKLMRFNLDQYLRAVQFEWREGDPQKCVPEAECEHEWEGTEVNITDPHDTRQLAVGEKYVKSGPD